MFGAAVGTAVIVGALTVGDSVRYSLEKMALARLGDVQQAMVSNMRFFRDVLADEISAGVNQNTAAVLQLSGIASRPDGARRANNIQVLGVEDDFWKLAAKPIGLPKIHAGQIVVNTHLSRQLNVDVGDDLVIRVETPGTLPRDMPLATTEDIFTILRAEIVAIADAVQLGDFSLRTNQLPAFNVFVSRHWLAGHLEIGSRANMLLVGGQSPGSVGELNRRLNDCWQLADAELELHAVAGNKQLELRSRRVFIDQVVGRELDLRSRQAGINSRSQDKRTSILTYFVNDIRAGDRSTPYSMVSAIEPSWIGRTVIPVNLADDEIVINTWLADDLSVQAGDSLVLSYFVMEPSAQLVERSTDFRIRKIIEIEGLAADHELMPSFPGLADAEHCRQWEPGIPVNLDRIRNKDESYWDIYRGTPKAFISLQAGQKIWANRFGDRTCIRIDPMEDSFHQVEQQILGAIQPEQVGLAFDDVRSSALAASRDSLDFGILFLALSMFIVIAAVLLTMLQFAFGVDQRAIEIGTLISLGWPVKSVRRVLMIEGTILAVFGSIIGCVVGMIYTRLVLAALDGIWSGAVAGVMITFSPQPKSWLVGGMVGVLVALLAMNYTLRCATKRSPKQLLSGAGLVVIKGNVKYFGPIFWVAVTCILASVAIVLMIWPQQVSSRSYTVRFFITGVLVLAGMLCLWRSVIAMTWRTEMIHDLSLAYLALRNTARRAGRSTATIILLSCGIFIIIAVSANRLDIQVDQYDRSAGTGGFALFGRTALPLYQDLNTTDGRKSWGFDEQDLQDVGVVPMRIRHGDDASCLNLNRAQSPTLIGVNPGQLAERNAFHFAKRASRHLQRDGWDLLDVALGLPDVIPAIADQATVLWALGKKLGDTHRYVDEYGQPFQVKFVGLLENSILQGNILISEDEFVDRFPTSSGYQLFLVDAPIHSVAVVHDSLARALEPIGMELSSTSERLGAFNTVQNTYLAIFQALGGLGMLLGSIGLGVVVMRNVLERVPELALMRAVGFSHCQLRRMIMSEHALLLVVGLFCGVTASLIAVIPMVRSGGQDMPWVLTIMICAAVFVSGLFWVWAASALALRRYLLDALRHE